MTKYITPIATPPDVQARINHLLEAVRPGIAQLRDRWQDEREYEDFTEYVDAAFDAVNAADPSIKVLRVTQRPLAVLFTAPFAPVGATYNIKATSSNVGWSRVS